MATFSDTYNLLIIEDDAGERKLINMTARDMGYPLAIKFLADGEEAVNYADSFPADDKIFSKFHLIILDLNLPKINGIEVLKSIKRNSKLNKTPVVVLTTSNSKTDVDAAYGAGASGFIRKPSVISDYESTIKTLFNYWLGICLLP